MVFLTKLKPEPMGAHSLSAAYGVNSLVMSEDGAAAYISVKDVPAGTPLSNTDYWQPHTDLSAVRQSAEAAAQKANAARDEMLEIARNLTDAVEKSGNPVRAELVGGLPFDRVVTSLEPIQSGSGDPSPTNIRAISGWTGAELTRCGKNLAKAVITDSATGKYYGSLWIDADLKPNTQYTLSFIATAGNSLYSNENLVSPAGNFTTTGRLQSITFTTKGSIDETDGGQYTSDKGWLILKNSETLTTPTVYTDVQLELGSTATTATTYAPYQGDTYAADFGQTVYGGTLDWQTGVLAVEWALVTLTGAETYNNYSSWANSGCCVVDAMPGAVEVPGYGIVADLICSHAPIDTVNKITATSGLIAVGQAYANLYISIGTEDKASLKSYLAAQYAAGTPVQIVYKLATPTTIQLTPQEIKQLQGMNTLYGDGSISIVGRANPALTLDARIAALEAAAPAE